MVGLFVVALLIWEMVPTRHAFAVAALRAMIGTIFLFAAWFELVPLLTAFLGKGFLFLALYGLAAPIESQVVGSVATKLTGQKSPQ